MENESKYYSPVPVIEYAEKINCPFIAIAGGKGNGKTYGIIQYYLKVVVIYHKAKDNYCQLVEQY